MDRLNFFNPFRHKPLEYEDVLTRAFFVLMRYEPLALAAFVDLVRDVLADSTSTLPRPIAVTECRTPPLLYTQTGSLDAEEGYLVSVLLTDSWDAASPSVELVDRTARYDGVLQLDDWTFVVESKPDHRDVDPGQLCPSTSSLAEDHNVELLPFAVCLPWNRVFLRLQYLEEAGLLSAFGGRMVHDFLDLVDQDHPGLAPYSSFRICGGNLVRLRRRAENVVAEIAAAMGAETRERVGRRSHVFVTGGVAQEVHLTPRQGDGGDWRLDLELWPADTVGQARRFFNRVDPDEFLGLAEQGWEVSPNLHFSFMSTHLHWSSTSAEAADYFDLWASGTIAYGGTAARGFEYESRLTSMLEHRVITPGDVEELHRHFRDTARNHMNVIPGFRLRYDWPGATAEELDARGELVREVVERIGEARATWEARDRNEGTGSQTRLRR